VIFDKHELAQAVLFFDRDGNVSREMHLAEFQAVLDGFASLHELAGVELQAAYVEFNHSFHLRRVVCFLLPIDGGGDVMSSWSLPLLQLAQEGEASRDLGAGPIQLACRSQCPITYCKQSLWDPNLSAPNDHLNSIANSIKNNGLAVQFREDSEVESGAKLSDQQRLDFERALIEKVRAENAKELNAQTEQLLGEQRLQMAAFQEQAAASEQKLKQEYDRQLVEYQRLLDEKSLMVEEQRSQNHELKATIDRQAEKFSETKTYYENQLANTVGHFDEEEREAYRSALQADFDAQFLAKTKEVQETLQTREVELLYRDELESQLHHEISRLREDKQHAIENTGNQLLQQLIQSGISLVTFQPGAGHLTLPVSDITTFLESPTAYAAERCGVNAERYEAWLEHYHMPICQAVDEQGHICGEPIDRVEQPIDYREGESELCTECLAKNKRKHLRLAEG